MGSSRSRGDEGFTGEWAPRRQCRCSGSPARSAHAPGPCPDPRRSPPSWLEAEEPAGAAPSGPRERAAGGASAKGRGGRARARAEAPPSGDPGAGRCPRPMRRLGRGGGDAAPPLSPAARPSCGLVTSLTLTCIIVLRARPSATTVSHPRPGVKAAGNFNEETSCTLAGGEAEEGERAPMES